MNAIKKTPGLSIRKKYHGEILYANTLSHGVVVIRCTFNDIKDYPDLPTHVKDFVASRPADAETIYKFEGSYMLFKNGKPSFSGTCTPL